MVACKTVLIPEENVKDLQDIPENAKNNLEIVPVRWIDQVLEVALERMPQPLPDDEPAKEVQKPAEARARGGSGRAAALTARPCTPSVQGLQIGAPPIYNAGFA